MASAQELAQPIAHSSYSFRRSDVAYTDNRPPTVDPHPCLSDALCRRQNACYAPGRSREPTDPLLSLYLCSPTPPPPTPSTLRHADMDSENTTTTATTSTANVQKLDLGALLLGCVIQAMYVIQINCRLTTAHALRLVYTETYSLFSGGI